MIYYFKKTAENIYIIMYCLVNLTLCLYPVLELSFLSIILLNFFSVLFLHLINKVTIILPVCGSEKVFVCFFSIALPLIIMFIIIFNHYNIANIYVLYSISSLFSNAFSVFLLTMNNERMLGINNVKSAVLSRLILCFLMVMSSMNYNKFELFMAISFKHILIPFGVILIFMLFSFILIMEYRCLLYRMNEFYPMQSGKGSGDG